MYNLNDSSLVLVSTLLQFKAVTAESFVSVNLFSDGFLSNNSTVNLFCFISFQMFFLSQLYWHFLYCFGFDLKKPCRKSKHLQQQLNN